MREDEQGRERKEGRKYRKRSRKYLEVEPSHQSGGSGISPIASLTLSLSRSLLFPLSFFLSLARVCESGIDSISSLLRGTLS